MIRFSTAGESHGAAVITVLEGIPHGLALDIPFIDAELARRQGGYGRGGRMRIEKDQVEVLSGLRGGVTLGSPITLMIRNKDHTLDKLGPLTKLRPGHVDLAGCLKYGTSDARDVLERASARETAGRVLAGAVCACLLREFGVQLFGHVLSVGAVVAEARDLSMGPPGLVPVEAWAAALRKERDASDFYAIAPGSDPAMRAAEDEARRSGDTLGGMVEVLAFGVPPGLGSHTQRDRKLDGRIAQACLSVQAMKSVEIGLGREVATKPGSAVHDPIVKGVGPVWNPSGLTRPTNHAGGIEGGISNGMPIVVRCAMKPIATLMRPLATVDLATGIAADAAKERSDICAVPAASVVLEHALAVPLAQAWMDKFGGDSMREVRRNYDGYRAQLAETLPRSND